VALEHGPELRRAPRELAAELDAGVARKARFSETDLERSIAA